MYKEKKEILEDEKEVNENFEKVEIENPYSFGSIVGLGLGAVLMSIIVGPSSAFGGLCIAIPLKYLISRNKYIKAKEEYLADSLKLVRENKYQQMVIEEQKDKLMLSMATLAYVSTDNYSDFDRFYKENISEILGSEYKDNIEDALIRHRIYLTSNDKDEFRENLENEYSKKSSKSDDKVLVKKK